MGMQVGNRGSRRRAMSEINVTPFVDVMLVLLIIFMVTAPMMTSNINVNLPKSGSGAAQQQQKPLVVTVDAEGDVYLQDEKIDPGMLGSLLLTATGGDQKTIIHLRGDETLAYGALMGTMDAIRQAGFERVALLTQAGQ